MKTLLILLAAAALSCSRPQPISEPYPHYLIEEEDWIVYEGTLPASDGPDVHVELSLFPGAPGLGSGYKLMEYPDGAPWHEVFARMIRSSGQYLVLSSPKGRIIHISDRNYIKAISMRGDLRMPEFGKENLYLQSDGEDKLVFVDEDMREKHSDYVLTRRSSPLFTVEGYFSVYNDTTDFYERNTGKAWAVARLGRYGEAVKKYDYLAKEKFEGVYMKALAYTVRHLTHEGKEIHALVFKKILHMDTTAHIN